MNVERSVATGRVQSALDTNKVLRNTYMLLSMTLLFSAAVAGISMALALPYPGIIITLVRYLGLLFAVERTKHSALGIVFDFALAGLMRYTHGQPSRIY